MSYIELNPVRAGMVAHPAEYPWSSYPRNGLGVGDALVAEHDPHRRLGRTAADCCSAYRQLFGAHIGRAETRRQIMHANTTAGAGYEALSALSSACSAAVASARPGARLLR